MTRTLTSQLQVVQVIEHLLRIAPTRYAMNGDVIGLQLGSRTQFVRKIWIALDPSVAVMEAAVNADVDLLINHHALLYRPLKQIDLSTRRGAAIARVLARPLTIINAHTNLDIAPGGVNDVLAERLGLSDCEVLDVHGYEEADDVHDGAFATAGMPYGLGRVGNVTKDTNGRWPTLAEFATTVKQRLGMEGIRYVGDGKNSIRRVAVVGGSGSSLVSRSIAAGADVLVTADCGHHDVLDAWEAGIAVIDATHAAIETPILPVVASKLKAMLFEDGYDVLIEVAPVSEDPFVWQ